MTETDVAHRFPDDSSQSLEAFIAACAPGATVELAPGRFEGPIYIDKPLVIRGAGDLTRIVSEGNGRVIEVNLGPNAEVLLEHLLVEGGDAESGGGIWLGEGRLRLHNVHIQHCQASGGGGAICVAGGELDASVLRVNDVSSDRGGALWVHGQGAVSLRDSQILGSEARKGGAFAIEGGARVRLESVTVSKSRATTPSGGQALYVLGDKARRPRLSMHRVRLEDAPFGVPLFVDPQHPGDVSLSACDVPRMLQSVVGVVDGGENHWR